MNDSYSRYIEENPGVDQELKEFATALDAVGFSAAAASSVAPSAPPALDPGPSSSPAIEPWTPETPRSSQTPDVPTSKRKRSPDVIVTHVRSRRGLEEVTPLKR